MMNESKDGATPLISSGVGLKLETTMPSAIKRWRGHGASGSVASTLRGLQNKKLSMPDSEALPNGWARIKHPDSGVYYVHEEKGISTFSDVLQPRMHFLIMQGADVLERSPALQAVIEDQEIDLVLDVRYVNGATKTCYYCVSHLERRIFWLEGIGHEEVEIPCTSNNCMNGKGSRVHCIEAQYWEHCELFPTTLTVTKDITGELKGILLQAAADRLLVKFSTSPYDKDHLEYMLKLVREIEDARGGSGHAAWIIARFMALCNDGVLQSTYGQGDEDYFDAEDIRPRIGPYQRHAFLTFIGPLFLKSPDVFAGELHSFHENFTLDRWSKFVHKVDQSIRDSNLLATVLLSTNVGLLAWSENGKTGPTGISSPSPEQIMTYISIICSVGSIIIGLAIFKQYRATGADTPLRAVVLLKRILEAPFGLESLAIICSLPYVLLMWGLLAFLAAFGIIFYRDTGIEVRIPVSLALFFVVFCVLFCWFTARPPKNEEPRSRKQLPEDGTSSSRV